MSSLTPRLALKRPDGADPFLRQDFIDNWNKIDAAPGVHVCTSSSRPQWNASQAGRSIIETDTMRRLDWTGTAWAEPRVAIGQWGLTTAPGSYTSSGTTSTFTQGNITLLRPAQIMTITTVRAAAQPYGTQSVLFNILYDDVDRTLGGNAMAYIQWSDLSLSTTVNYDHRTCTFIGQGNLGVGTHNIKVRSANGSGGTTVYIGAIQTSVLIISGQGGQDTLL